MSLVNNSVETVNAAATAIVSAESRVQPTSVQVSARSDTDLMSLDSFSTIMYAERLDNLRLDRVRIDIGNESILIFVNF